MRSPACLIFALLGLFSFVPASDAGRGGGGSCSSRPVARVSRVTAAPRVVTPIRTAAQSQASFRALRKEVRHDLGANRRQNRNPIIAASGYPYGYYGSDPGYGLAYTPNESTASESDGTSSCPLPSASAAPLAFNPENGESRDDLYREQARLQADLEASPGWAAANADISTSRAAIAAARQHVDESLTASPEYQVARSQKAAAEDLLATLRSSDHPDQTQIWSAAENKLQASQTMTRLEQQALASNSSYSGANSRLQSAAAVRNAMLGSLRARMQNQAR